jgi:hypothetical protein
VEVRPGLAFLGYLVEYGEAAPAQAVTFLARCDRVPVEYLAYGGDPNELGDEQFDVVISKNAITHYGTRPSTPDAELMVHRMPERLHDGGLLAIRAARLWKAPTADGSTLGCLGRTSSSPSRSSSTSTVAIAERPRRWESGAVVPGRAWRTTRLQDRDRRDRDAVVPTR